MRIAICDDDFAEVKMISQHIRSHKHPHEVTLFASPIPLLEQVYSGAEFDLVFLDIQMPDGNGWEIAKKLKSLNRNIYIAMVTVLGEYIFDCFDRVNWFAPKPVTCDKIGAVGLRLGAISDRGRAEDTLATNVEKMKQIKSLQQKISSEEDSEAFKIIYASDEQKMRDSEYGHNCGMGQTIVKISPTGDISPCLMSEIVVGNALSDSIKSVQLKYSRIFENIHIPSVTFCSGCQNEILCANCINEALLHKK